MAGNSALSAAVKAKKDEFYTQLTDIEKEMRYYRKHFKDKTVLCNCDDPFESNFFKYFVLNFNRLGLKKLIATCYFSSPIIGQQLQYHFNQDGQMTFSFGDDTSDDYKAKRPYKAIVTSVYDTTGDGGVDRLWYIGKQFIQFLCYRKNVEFSKVELAAPCENGTHETFAELYVLDEGVDTEIQTLKDGRYIKQAYISGHEGQILSDIASEKLYLRHLPDSFQSGKHIDAARFVMITAAFEWEFDRLFPDGICKSKERVEAELIVSQKLNELIDTSSGKTKKIYKSLLKCIERRPSLANKIEKIGSDMGALLEPFGQQLYGFNKEELNYTDMGKRLGDQRNYFAHGDLDKDFIGLSLLDLIFLQRIIYAIQLKISGLEDKQIQRAINDLFQCRFAI